MAPQAGRGPTSFARLFKSRGLSLGESKSREFLYQLETRLNELMESTPDDGTKWSRQDPLEEARRQWLKQHMSGLGYRAASEIHRRTGEPYQIIVRRALQKHVKKL